MSVFTIDIHFGKHREGDAVIDQAAFGDGFFIARLLVGKLVAGKSQNDQSPVLVFLVKGFQSFVLGGEAAFAGGIYYQHGLVLVGFHFNVLALYAFCFKLIKVTFHNALRYYLFLFLFLNALKAPVDHKAQATNTGWKKSLMSLA